MKSLFLSILLVGAHVLADAYDDKSKLFANAKTAYPFESHLYSNANSSAPFSTCTLTKPNGDERVIMRAGENDGISDLIMVKYIIPIAKDSLVVHTATNLELRGNVNNWLILDADVDEHGTISLDRFLDNNDFNPLARIVSSCKTTTHVYQLFQTRMSGVSGDGASYEIISTCSDGAPFIRDQFRVVGDNMIGARYYGNVVKPSYIFCNK